LKKYPVTNELSALIKTLRIQRKISSKNLALHIGKSHSYISKFENGEIRNIQEEELTAILDYIVEGDDFFNDKLPAIIRTLSSIQEPDRMSQQIWLLDYDILKRPITLPESMVDDINERLRELNISVARLTALINENKDSAMSQEFPPNEIVDFVLRDSRVLLVRNLIEEETLAALLEKRTFVTSYSFAHALAFTLFRIQNYDDNELEFEEARDTLQNTRAYLDGFGVYSLTEWNRLLSDTKTMESQRSLLASFSTANAETINQIILFFRIASEHDILHTAQALETFRENLSWDQGFALKLISQPFHELDDISFSLKKQLLEEVNSLIEKYKNVPASEKKFETYF